MCLAGSLLVADERGRQTVRGGGPGELVAAGSFPCAIASVGLDTSPHPGPMGP